MHSVGFEVEERHWPMKSEVIPNNSCVFPSTAVPHQSHIASTYGFPLVFSFGNYVVCFCISVIFSLCTCRKNQLFPFKEIHVDSEEF
jgi:hypothetical protein